MRARWSIGVAGLGLLVALTAQTPRAQQRAAHAPGGTPGPVEFQTSDNCVACHNGLTAPDGEDVSIGSTWSATMMANASRDPYWHAGVRRESIDHPTATKAIEAECSICHMPMARTVAHAAGREGEVFRLLPSLKGRTEEHRLAADGVSCALCHQIAPEGLGTPESFTGRFVISPPAESGPRMYGPYEVDRGRTRLMRSSTGASPTEAKHLRESEVCGTCHTLITHALGPKGESIGRLPEQVPYQEWRHSAFVKERSCQACHMPDVAKTPMASVLGEPRERFARHTFVGGNFFMLRVLNKFRDDLGVTAEPQAFEAAVQATLRQLETQTASIAVAGAVAEGALRLDVDVRNLTGHKLPTGYPSRRVWIHLTVRDTRGQAVFESGAIGPTGAIAGNDNDAAAGTFEPHYQEIVRPDQVQIYESVLGDPRGGVTTGLLTAVRYLKDNRLLPRGFDKATAEPDIAVHGEALADADFTGERDRVRYRIPLGGATGPFTVAAELRYQPIGFRWADNLRAYKAPEPQRFLGYWDTMADASSTVLARTAADLR